MFPNIYVRNLRQGVIVSPAGFLFYRSILAQFNPITKNDKYVYMMNICKMLYMYVIVVRSCARASTVEA